MTKQNISVHKKIFFGIFLYLLVIMPLNTDFCNMYSYLFGIECKTGGYSNYELKKDELIGKDYHIRLINKKPANDKNILIGSNDNLIEENKVIQNKLKQSKLPQFTSIDKSSPLISDKVAEINNKASNNMNVAPSVFSSFNIEHEASLMLNDEIYECENNSIFSRPYVVDAIQEDLLLVTQLTYADYLLSDEVFTYSLDGKYYLPFKIIVEQLLLPLEINIDTKVVTGWFIDESRLINVSQGIMDFWLNNDDCNNSLTNIFFDDWDLYIESSVIQQMLGITLTFDSTRQSFSIGESSSIPLTQSLDRINRYSLFYANKNKSNFENVRDIKPEYALVGDVAGSADIGVSSREFNNNTDTNVDGFLQVRTDLLKHNAYLSYSFSDNSEIFNGYIDKHLQDSWINNYRVGSISSADLNLVSGSTNGHGIRVSAGSQFTSDFRHIVVEGEVEPGWDVELYRNNILIDIEQVKDSGQYYFSQVPYYIGLNNYELKFYGPNGEFRTESFNKLLDSAILEPGAIGVNMGAMVRKQDNLKQYYTDINWAILDNLTTGISLVNQQDYDQQWQFLPQASISFLGDSHLIQLNYAASKSGYAAALAAQGRQDYLNWQAEWRKYNQFSSWDKFDENIKEELFFNGFIQHSGVNWGLGGRWRDLDIGESFTVNANVSGQLFGLDLSNNLFWEDLNSNTKWADRFTVSGRLNDLYIRSYVDFELAPELEFSNWITNVNFSINHITNYEFEFRYHPQNSNRYSVNNTITHHFDYGSLRFVVNNSFDGNWHAQIRWHSSFLWETGTLNGLIDRGSSIHSGSVKIIAFQDDNANGIFDGDDSPISGISFSGHGQTHNKTDNNGELLITNLQTHRPQILQLKENSLPDPFLIALDPVISVQPHSGYIQSIFYPVLSTSEIEGQVFIVQDTTLSETTNFRVPKGKEVFLLSTNSDKSYSGKVEYDGIFIIDKIAPGDYVLKIEDNILQYVKVESGDFIDVGIFHVN